MPNKFLQKIVSCLLSLLLFGSLVGRQSDAVAAVSSNVSSGDAMQMADILGIRSQVDRLRQLQGSSDPSAEQEVVALKAQVLQKILTGFLEVRRASDRNWRELSWSFNVMRREQRHQDLINELFTLANFAQLGTLYTCEPFFRLNGHFVASALCTTTGNGLGLTLPTLNILQQKTAHAKHVAPPEAMKEIIDGGPVDASGLPEFVDKYFDLPSPGSSTSRRDEMFATWKKRYGVDASYKANLCSLEDEAHTKRTIGTLHKRILLLFSLRTFILSMDTSLLALLNQLGPSSLNRIDAQVSATNLAELGLDARALEAAKLLDIQPQIAQLISLNKSGDSFSREQVEVNVLQKLLTGALEVRCAADQIDAEINYANDVVLSELLAKRGKALQLNFETNFIQAGTFGCVAGLLYLTHHGKPGNEMFVISGGIGTVLSTLALRLMRGGERKIDSEPNALADVFSLRQRGEYRFSPMMATFLSSPDPAAKTGKTRREDLMQYWQEQKSTTVKLTDTKNLESLAAMPPAQFDTIKIVTNRISMLHRLNAHIEQLDPELLDLLRATDNNSGATQEPLTSNANMTAAAVEAANLLGVQSLVNRLHAGGWQSGDPATLNARLLLTRKVLTTAIDVRSTIDTLDDEISHEYDVLGRMTRQRDKVIALTNNVNFYQLGILAIIIDGGIGLSASKRTTRASNILNIVSGLAVASLAGLTVLELRGGKRPAPAHPNMLGQCLGISPPDDYRFSPVIWQFINSVPPSEKNGRTRVERMRNRWKEARKIYPNMEKQSVREKMAAYGHAHSNHCETIKLMKSRLDMLFDVQGLVGLFDGELADLMRSVS